ARYPGLDETRLIHEAIRRLIDRMVRDLVAETGRQLAASGVRSVDEVRRLGEPVAAFSQEMWNHDRALKRFLSTRMYRHYRVNRSPSWPGLTRPSLGSGTRSPSQARG